MRFLFAVLFICTLAAATPAQAQILQITATGEFTSGTGTYSDIAGTTFSFSETFNVANATLIASNGMISEYQDPAGSLTFSFGEVSSSQSAPDIDVVANDVVSNPGSTYYGFAFVSSQVNTQLDFELLSFDPTVSPTTSLDNVRTLPLSDFETSDSLGNEAIYEDFNGNATGTVTSFSVEEEAAPEPSTLGLFILGAGLLCLRFRRRHSRA